MTRTTLGYHGLYVLTPHALARIRARFGIQHPAEALLWTLARMAESARISCEMGRPYINAPRIVWRAGNVRIVTDGNEVITAFVEGEIDDEREGAA